MKNPIRLLSVVAIIAFSAGALADVPRFYVHQAVQGDTLIKLANRFLSNKNDWQSLQTHNALKEPNRISVGTAIRIPVGAMRTEPVPPVVMASKGRVELGAVPVTSGLKLREGDAIKTGDDGFVTLLLADGSTIAVQAKSLFRIERARQLTNTDGVMDSIVRLDSGRLETRAAKQKGAAARFEIRTPTSNMGVRGTVFRVAADESGNKGQGEVTEGLVGVESASNDAAAPSKALGLAAGFGSIVEAGKPPSAPVALLAAPDLKSLPPRAAKANPSFTFPPVGNAVAYRGQIAADEKFTRLIADASATSPTLQFADLPDGELFFRARGVDVLGLEGNDAVHAFQIAARPFAPVLQLPPESGRMNNGNVRFVWKPAADAVSYRLQVAQREDFAKPIIDKPALILPAHAIEAPLKSGTYVWRMASINAKGAIGPWSDAQRFEVRATAPLLRPKHGQKNIVLLLDGGANQYQVQVARDERFSKIVLDRVASGTDVELTGLGVNVYYVRLRTVTVNAGAVPTEGGLWSETGTLEVYPNDWWLATYPSPAR